MSSKLRVVLKTFSVLLAAIVSGALASAVYAADAPSAAVVVTPDAAQKPLEGIEELDEVWVRGKRLSEVIEDAEDDFFLLYNKLNKDSQYDVYCGRMYLNNGSMIMVRKCVPGFIVYNYGDVFGTVNYGGGCTGSYVGEGSAHGGYIPCSTGDVFGYVSSTYSGNLQPPSGLMMMSKRPAYAANVLKVVTSDPHLLEKVRNLGVLYKDMELVQGRYVMIKGDGPPARQRRKGTSPHPT